MNIIIFSMELLMRGPAVVDLQAALHLLLDRGVIPVANEDERRELSTLLQREPQISARSAQAYDLNRTWRGDQR